jgi:hypothetical protein
MTPDQLTRALSRLSPPVQRAIRAQLAAWERQGRRVSLDRVAALIEGGNTTAVVALLLGDAVADTVAVIFPDPLAARGPAAIAANTRTEQALVRATAQAALDAQRMGVANLPPKPPGSRVTAGGLGPDGVPLPPSVRFVPGLPTPSGRAVTYAGDALSYLRAEAHAGVRGAIESGLAQGLNPRDVARGIRDVVGLGESQAVWVANLRAEIEAGDLRAALDRKLVNGPIRQTLAARLRNGTPLSAADIDKIVGTYADKWRAWHAETVSRTMTLDLLRSGQLTAVRAAVARGEYAGLSVRKVWVTTLDGRERDSHRALNRSAIPLDAQWNDAGTMRDVPGGWNCRCAMSLLVRPA